MLESTVVLSRAVSAPSYGYGAQSILRNSSIFPSEGDDSPQRNASNVTFAPLPQTEMFGRRRKFSGKLGTQGRSGILNKQRQHPNGINYVPNTVENTSEQVAQEVEESGTPDDQGGSPANSTTNLQPPKPDLSLRRSASEDGTSTTTTNSKKSSGFKFWKKVSKRPALTTVPSHSSITPNSQLATTTPSGEPAAAASLLAPEEVASQTRGFTENDEENQETVGEEVSKSSSYGHLSIDTITHGGPSPMSGSPSIVITPSSAPTSPTVNKPTLEQEPEDKPHHSLDASDSVSSSNEVASTLESVEAMEISGHPLGEDKANNTIPTANL